jgi:hypothetical protein
MWRVELPTEGRCHHTHTHIQSHVMPFPNNIGEECNAGYLTELFIDQDFCRFGSGEYNMHTHTTSQGKHGKQRTETLHT